jgi:hypothetical protein
VVDNRPVANWLHPVERGTRTANPADGRSKIIPRRAKLRLYRPVPLSRFFLPPAAQAAWTSERIFSGFFSRTQASAVPSMTSRAKPSRKRIFFLPRMKWSSNP